MADGEKDPPAGRVQRFRFRVVAPDGRELVSDVVQVQFPPPPLATLQPAGILAEPLVAAVQKGPEPANFRVSAIDVAIRGRTQGALKGESAEPGKGNQFAALAFDYVLQAPVDLSTGHAAGKRRHSPVTIVKEWGAATPQLFQALVTSELLETVDIDCYGVAENGEMAVVHKIKLTNASVVSLRHTAGAGDHDGSAAFLETVALSFTKIERLSPAGAVLASDGA